MDIPDFMQKMMIETFLKKLEGWSLLCLGLVSLGVMGEFIDGFLKKLEPWAIISLGSVAVGLVGEFIITKLQLLKSEELQRLQNEENHKQQLEIEYLKRESEAIRRNPAMANESEVKPSRVAEQKYRTGILTRVS